MNYRTTLATLGLFLLAGSILRPNANADIITFTNLASWEAALTGAATLEDFEGVVADIDFTGSSTTVGALGLSSIEESAFSNNALVDVLPFVSASDINGGVHVSMRFLQNDSVIPDSVTVALVGGLSAFAFEYLNYDTQGDGTMLTFTGTNGGTVGGFDSTAGGTGPTGAVFFFGVIDTGVGATISSFSFTADSTVGTGISAFNSFDDVRFGVATAVPEPSSMLLVAIGLGFAGFRRRR